MSSHGSSGEITKTHLWDFVLSLIVIISFVFLFTSYASGASVEQVETRDINAGIPSSFVSVQGDVAFDSVLPGYNYERQLVVSLNLPQAALNGLRSSNVTVFVKLSTLKGDGSAISFETDGVEAKLLRFSLVCTVRNSTCIDSSVMSKTVNVKFFAPPSGYPYVDRVVVNSSLEAIPLDEVEEKTQEVLASLKEVEKKAEELKKAAEAKFIPSVNLSQQFQELNSSISEATRHASGLNVAEAQTELEKAKAKLSFLQDAINNNTSSQRSQPTGLFTGFDRDFSTFWQPLILACLAFAVLCIYFYSREKSDRKKSVNIDKFMRENE